MQTPRSFSERAAQIDTLFVDLWRAQVRRNGAMQRQVSELEQEIALLRRDLDLLSRSLHDAFSRAEGEQ